MPDVRKALLLTGLLCVLCLTGRVEAVEVVLKSGKIIRGELILETSTTITLQLTSNQIEISKLTIKSIDGRPPFEPHTSRPVPQATRKDEIEISAGDFLMGNSRSKHVPIHNVYLDAFQIDTREVTNAQYRRFIKQTGHQAPRYWQDPKYNTDDQPVVGVTWRDAQAYCAWRGKRLPTEAEWERAARGTQSRLYPWGDRFDVSRTNTRESKNRRPMAVGSYPSGASPDGLLDMSGNVWEWCNDWFGKEYYLHSPHRNPSGPAEGKKRVIRGGGWTAPETDMANRRGEKPSKTYPSLGFRCARSKSN